MITRENENIMVELGDRVEVANPVVLQQKLAELGQKLADKLPLGYDVKIARVGGTDFQLGISSQRGIIVQAFGIHWNPVSKFVSWAAIL